MTEENLRVVFDVMRIDDLGVTKEQLKKVKDRVFFLMEKLWDEPNRDEYDKTGSGIWRKK